MMRINPGGWYPPQAPEIPVPFLFVLALTFVSGDLKMTGLDCRFYDHQCSGSL
ncbi:hypothetical protein ECP03047993_5403 [Escherichia coli P0304799.3]|nr:hypothetical protein ECP03047993_5403 [Escherichia coli P0304799.3]